MSSLDLRKVGTLQDIAEVQYPEPPENFDERHRKVFDRIIKTRAAVQWKDGVDIELAVELARVSCDLEDERQLLKDEGMVVTGPRGGVAVNPRLTACNSLRNAILRFEGRLRLGTLDSRDPTMTKRGMDTARHLEQMEALSADDGLIPSPLRGPQPMDDGLLPRFAPTPLKQ